MGSGLLPWPHLFCGRIELEAVVAVSRKAEKKKRIRDLMVKGKAVQIEGEQPPTAHEQSD